MKLFWWVAIILGILAVLGVLGFQAKTTPAPLNASGYTYPGTAGA
jgi:hypothetical protein